MDFRPDRKRNLFGGGNDVMLAAGGVFVLQTLGFNKMFKGCSAQHQSVRMRVLQLKRSHVKYKGKL